MDEFAIWLVILCAVLITFPVAYYVGRDDGKRRALRFLASNTDYRPEPGPVPRAFCGISNNMQRLDNRHIGGILCGLAGSLCTYFHPTLVRDAFTHVAHDTTIWFQMEAQHDASWKMREWEYAPSQEEGGGDASSSSGSRKD